MIKVNLLTVKRRKPIQIPFAAIFLVIGVVGIVACFMAGTGMIENMNSEALERKDELNREIQADRGKLDAKESRKKELDKINNDINTLEELTGSNLLQWSQVFSDLLAVVPEKTVWITNLRIDSDRRVQITAYACNEAGVAVPKTGGQLTKGIQTFIKNLQGHVNFEDVFLQSANKNIYEKMPVWRFELNCRVKRDLGNEGSEGLS